MDRFTHFSAWQPNHRMGGNIERPKHANAVRDHGRRLARWALTGVVILSAAAPASAEYRVDAGDTIEIFVAQVPELQRRVSVKLDGSISFPLLGTLPVAGLTSSQLQEKIQVMLATKVFQQRTSDGREIDVVIIPDEVTAAVVEYRPIYVNGDVSKPGEFPYRPSMTARHAVATSGGYDLQRVRILNPYLEATDLKSDFDALWAELAKEQAHVWRVKSALGQKDNVDKDALLDVPVPRLTAAAIVKVETEHLMTAQADNERQIAYLNRAIKQCEDQIGFLSMQEQTEEQGAKSDAEELQRVVALFDKGSLVSPRVTDARRAVLLSATRKLQTSAQLMQMKRQQDELARQKEQLGDRRHIELLGELQDAAGKVAVLRAKVQAVGEKLQYMAAKRQSGRAEDIKHEITIIRKVESRREHITANEDTELEPGDVVEVGVRVDQSTSAATR